MAVVQRMMGTENEPRMRGDAQAEAMLGDVRPAPPIRDADLAARTVRQLRREAAVGRGGRGSRHSLEAAGDRDARRDADACAGDRVASRGEQPTPNLRRSGLPDYFRLEARPRPGRRDRAEVVDADPSYGAGAVGLRADGVVGRADPQHVCALVKGCRSCAQPEDRAGACRARTQADGPSVRDSTPGRVRGDGLAVHLKQKAVNAAAEIPSRRGDGLYSTFAAWLKRGSADGNRRLRAIPELERHALDPDPSLATGAAAAHAPAGEPGCEQPCRAREA